MMEELKPCPFCGGEALLSWRYSPDDYEVEYYAKCIICGATGKIFKVGEPPHVEATKQLVIKAWNMRTNK